MVLKTTILEKVLRYLGKFFDFFKSDEKSSELK